MAVAKVSKSPCTLKIMII